jgi:GT2 family glycosyltransferase
MKVLAIIVSYNFLPWVDKCLPSLMSSTYPVDIMVIDNGSEDESLDYVKKNYPSVKVVNNHANLGFGKANNIGILYAMENGYDSVLLINQDAWLDVDALAKLVDALEKHPCYGIVSPIHKNGADDKLDSGFATYSEIKELKQLPLDTIVEVPFINAAIWLVSIAVLKKTGLFASLFYHYGEDKDLTNRMTFYNYKIGYVPTAFGYHDREYRETSKEKFFWSEYVYHLTEFANVNHSFGKAFVNGVLAVAVKAIVSFLHARWDDSRAYDRVGMRLLRKSKDVLKSRRMSRHVDLNDY